jgi:DNA-binding transcriptional LysR family regulator
MRKKGEFDFNLLRAMEVFVTVAEIGQVTKAARLLGMTQSAASQQLRALEGAFGSRLIDRTSRPIRLTQAGVALHKRAAQILSEIEELKAQVRRLEHIPVPLLRIGLLSSLAGPLSPFIVRHCKERMQVPELILRTGLASDHQELLRTREVDLIVTSDALYDLDGLERHVLMSEPFYLVVPRAFNGPVDDLAALAESLPLIRFTAKVPLGRRIEQHLRRLRLDIPHGLEADRGEVVLAIVAAGLGFAILTPTLLLDRGEAAPDVKIRCLPTAQLSRTISLVARERELGNIPGSLAGAIREALAAQLERRLAGRLPKAAPRPQFGDFATVPGAVPGATPAAVPA